MGEALVELDRGVDVTQQTPALGHHQAQVLAAAQSLRTRHHRRLQPPPLLRDFFELGDQLRQGAGAVPQLVEVGIEGRRRHVDLCLCGLVG